MVLQVKWFPDIDIYNVLLFIIYDKDYRTNRKPLKEFNCNQGMYITKSLSVNIIHYILCKLYVTEKRSLYVHMYNEHVDYIHVLHSNI